MKDRRVEKHKRFSPPFSLYPSALSLFCSSLFCVILLTLPARAQYMRSGLLNWTYDDFAVKTTEGTRKAAGFSQSYSYSMDGPLGYAEHFFDAFPGIRIHEIHPVGPLIKKIQT